MATKKSVNKPKPADRYPNPQPAVSDTSGNNLADFKNMLLNTPERAANNLLNVVKSTPLGIATQTAIKGVNTFKSEGYKAAVKEQAKIAGTTLAIQAATSAAGAAASKVIPKIAQSGLPQRLANTLKRETVVLHGTGEVLKNPKTGVPYRFDAKGKPLDKGAILQPRAGSPALPDTPAVFGWNPKYLDGMGSVENQLQIYSQQQRSFGYAADTPGFVPQNQVVVGTAKTKTVRPQDSNDAIQEVLGPVKIKQIVKTDQPLMQYYNQLSEVTKKAGAKTAHGGYKDKVERAIKNKIEKTKPKNSKKGIM